MRHLIGCMSSYGRESLESWLRQFPIDDDLHFIIHIDAKSREDGVNVKVLRRINPNVDEVFNFCHCKRFSSDMAKVMFELMRKCWERKYDYFHLMSESCWLIKPVDMFKKTFEESGQKSFMQFYKDKPDYNFWIAKYMDDSKNWYKSSQWISLSRKLLDLIFINDEFEKILYKICYDFETNNQLYLYRIAFDEFAIQNVILKYVLNDDNDLFNEYFVRDSLRYVNWGLMNTGSPRVLLQSEYDDPNNKFKYWKEKIAKCLIARKIDCKNRDSLAFVENQLNKYKS